jgi:hypothetical protein
MESFDAKRIGAPWGHEPRIKSMIKIKNPLTG